MIWHGGILHDHGAWMTRHYQTGNDYAETELFKVIICRTSLNGWTSFCVEKNSTLTPWRGNCLPYFVAGCKSDRLLPVETGEEAHLSSTSRTTKHFMARLQVAVAMDNPNALSHIPKNDMRHAATCVEMEDGPFENLPMV
jgi:hypothetical protein